MGSPLRSCSTRGKGPGRPAPGAETVRIYFLTLPANSYHPPEATPSLQDDLFNEESDLAAESCI